jgi:hypothetical protein
VDCGSGGASATPRSRSGVSQEVADGTWALKLPAIQKTTRFFEAAKIENNLLVVTYSTSRIVRSSVSSCSFAQCEGLVCQHRANRHGRPVLSVLYL